MTVGIFDDVFAVDDSPEETGHELEAADDGPDEQEGYPSQTEGEAQESTGTDTQPPKLYAGKYRTVDEMERAYQEAQSAMTQRSQEAAEYRRQVEEYNQYLQALSFQLAQQQVLAAQQAQQQAQPPQPAIPQKTAEEWMTEMYADPVATVAQLVEHKAQEIAAQKAEELYKQKLPELGALLGQTIGPILQQNKLQSLQQQKFSEVAEVRQKYPDFDSLREDIKTIIEQDPRLAQMPGGVEFAYKQAKYDKFMSQAQNQQMVANKQAAGMAGSVRVPQKTKTPEEAMADAIFGLDRRKRG